MPSSLFLLLLLLLSHLSSSTSAVSVLSPLLDSPYPAPPSTLHPHHLQHRNDGGPTLYVDCAVGSDTNSGTTLAAPLKTLPRAIALGGAWVEVSGGVCPLEAPVRVEREGGIVIRGDGKTALSGGRVIGGWQPSTAHSGGGRYSTGKIMVADVPAGFPLREIKSLRLGSSSLRRSRWPKLVGDGLTTPNFLFAQAWSSGTMGPNRTRSLQVRISVVVRRARLGWWKGWSWRPPLLQRNYYHTLYSSCFLAPPSPLHLSPATFSRTAAHTRSLAPSLTLLSIGTPTHLISPTFCTDY